MKKHVAYARTYKHEPKYYEEEYYEPTYEKYNDEYGYEEHKYDHKPMYKHKTMKSHYGYGGDSYDKPYSTYSSYKPSSYRHKRSISVRIGQKVGPDGSVRQGQQNQGSIGLAVGV